MFRGKEIAGLMGDNILPSLVSYRAKYTSLDDFIACVDNLTRNSRIRVFPSEWGICYFRTEKSECGGVDTPNYARRTPSVCLGCENLIVLDQHRPFHAWRVTEYRRLLADRPSAPAIVRADWEEKKDESEIMLRRLSRSRSQLT